MAENEQMWWILILPLHATSCHFKWRATSSGVCHFKWRATSSGVPLRVACWLCSLRVPSGVCHFKWRMPLQVACRTVSMPLHATSCHFRWRMPLQVAHATSSGVSHREHATSCHFKWRMPLQVAWSGEIGLRTSCVLNDKWQRTSKWGYVTDLKLVKGFHCSKSSKLHSNYIIITFEVYTPLINQGIFVLESLARNCGHEQTCREETLLNQLQTIRVW